MQARNTQWWKLKGEDLHAAVFSAARQQQEHDPRVRDLVAWLDLYSDTPRDDWASLGLFRDRRARYNVVQSGVDTVTGKLSKSRTRPWIVTSDGDYEARTRAKSATLWLDGQFDALKIYQLGEMVLRDAAIFGTGAAKFYARRGRPHVEVVWAGDLFVDPREERHRCVRTLYQIAAYDKGVLAQDYPEHAAAIDKAANYDDPMLRGVQVGPANLIQVVEVWRLPDGPELDDDEDGAGRHCIVIDGACLLDEGYDEECFPFEFLHWQPIPMRFWGQGLVERMSGGQSQLNRICTSLEDAYEHCPPASLWCESEAQIDVKKISNSPWKVHTYASGGAPPYVLTPNAISADFTAREEVLLSRIYQLAGISEMSAQSVKPAGLNSGKAMLVHQDVESERFYPQAKALEQWYVGVARHLLELADEVMEDESIKDKSVLDCFGGEKMLNKVRYVDAQLEDMPHQMRAFPVAALATSPQARLQQVADLMQLGILTDTSSARELLDFPDLERFNSVESAGRDLVDKTIGEALKGETVTAHPLMPLDYAVRKGTLEHGLAEIDGAPEHALQCLRDFISMAETLQQMAAAAAVPPESPAMPGAPMPGGPLPPAMPPEMGIAS